MAPDWELDGLCIAGFTDPYETTVNGPSFWSTLHAAQFESSEVLRMKIKITMAFLALFMFAGAAELATAQNKTKTTHKKTRTLSGCLQAGDDANEYKLTTAKGGTWEAQSDSVKLGDHVGHTVTITGVVSHAEMHGMKEDVKTEAREHGMGKHSTEHGHMTVTNLTMVSGTCNK
jgi:hypothetical protein